MSRSFDPIFEDFLYPLSGIEDEEVIFGDKIPEMITAAREARMKDQPKDKNQQKNLK